MPEDKLKLNRLLAQVAEQNASDLHLSVGKPPTLRIDGRLIPIEEEEVLSPDSVKELVLALLTDAQKERLLQRKEIDFSYTFEDKARFRVNAYFQKGTLAAALRLIPTKIKTLKELNLPEQLADFCKAQQGFFLSVGPAGHGKTTTIASMVDLVNHTRTDHIITIEDPIEYIFTQDKCMIDQREVHYDTVSFARALRSALRQDPDVIFVGEMRDLESIGAAVTLAETGHLVFSTLHTNNAPQTIDRMIDVFPPYQQNQIRVQLAGTLIGIVSQRLLPKRGGGLAVVTEVMKVTPAVRNIIREGKTYQLFSIIQTSAEEGMIPLDKSLAELVKSGVVDAGLAENYANDVKTFRGFLEE